MDSKEFLRKMIEEGKKHSAVQSAFVNVGRMTIQFGYSGMVTGHRMISLFKPFDEPGNSAYVAEEVNGRIAKLGGKGEAVLCMLVKVPEEFALNSKWGYERLISIFEEEDWDLILKTIDDLGATIVTPFWCKYELVDSPTAVAKGDKGKYAKKKDGVLTGKMVFPKIAIPTVVFANEMDARSAADEATTVAASSQWSQTVLDKHGPGGITKENQEEIANWFALAMSGVAFMEDAASYPLPIPRTPPAVKKYIADIYQAEPADIDVVISLEEQRTTTPPF